MKGGKYMTIYTVRSGDSIFSIASRYGVSSQSIIEANGLTNQDNLVIGQAIIVPSPGNTVYMILPGDSLYTIARKYGITVESILSANPSITNPELIYAGEMIRIPIQNKLGTIIVNGYAYTNITNETLNNTLPYLTFISPFSYEVRRDGSLTQMQDNSVIQTARANGVEPLMVITNIDGDNGFSSELAEAILTNDSIQDRLIDNIIATMQTKNYYGVTVDFEYIYPRNRDDYTAFLQELADRVNPLGYILVVTVAPKTSGTQEGLLYEAHDYGAIGTIADYVIIMTYEWGYTYGPPLPVAPANEVERVLRYATSVIPTQKILMGMPNYGYDWRLPYQQGTAARVVSNSEAVDLAFRVGAQIMYDQTAEAPYFNYYAEGAEHIVWFDDARSINARLRFINQYNLGGASYWTINRFFRPNWTVLDSLYDVRKL